MRNMSFAMTTKQFCDGTKDVTRRFGWWFLETGDKLYAVKKAMGLKKGEKIERLGIIEVISTRAEPLNAITREDCIREGFPDMSPQQFVDMLCKHYGCQPDKICNRIEFKKINTPPAGE